MKFWNFPVPIDSMLLAALVLLAAPDSYGNTEYYRHSFFDNSYDDGFLLLQFWQLFCTELPSAEERKAAG
jgi:hypothetical protein